MLNAHMYATAISIILSPWIVLENENIISQFVNLYNFYQRVGSESVGEHHSLAIRIKLIIICINISRVCAQS